MAELKSRSLSHPLKTEIVAGITSFLTMAYIAFVNPAILQDAGMDQGAVFTATCLVTAFACMLTGLFANTPIGVAPGMALNIYFSYSVVQTLGIDWQHALAMVFISGTLFFLVSLTPLRKLLIEAIPYNLQIAILIGISLLIALIALQTNQIVVGGPHTLMHLGNIRRPQTLLFLTGFLLILSLDYYRVRGAIIIGILIISVFSLLVGITPWYGLMSLPPSLEPTLFKLDFSGLGSTNAIKAIFTFFLIAVFDATGTLIGLLHPSIFKDQPNYTERMSKSLTADAAASAVAGLLGSASTSPFIESAAGIEAGGRTGKTALVIAAGFLLMLFFFPLAKAIPNFAVGPALLYVACCMMRHLGKLKLADISEIAPCMVTIMMIPFTFSIADGIGAGLILYVLLKLLTRQRVNTLLLVLSLLFVVFFFIS
ncbi:MULTISPECIES: NCS2 family permease [Legionella]|uniref:NCS2 family permease n=1 Tax=Legionella septentrionalis TaxID=2498109 RepID=A0A3S0VPB1_9GAMM|nr:MULTISPECIES: NCS2 family permease [Legionella]MCP0914751.1 NCS2 family permease [Legionella sp. 27cVA30]RUQ91106.1 NCS2 family permease [Legionella septentrionalis]RUR02825.1 NCS2 family permease [Legionella septentrionalis]RUR11423.1 NCS2 family permease [Legionella septentrionalis]RUR15102.1 NCS2 family permease [Legionella septentrionalis]